MIELLNSDEFDLKLHGGSYRLQLPVFLSTLVNSVFIAFDYLKLCSPGQGSSSSNRRMIDKKEQFVT